MSPNAWQQRIKWTVYTLLLVNFVLYLSQDPNAAVHTLGARASWLDWTRAYLTTIDLIAWFVLILFFELETGVLAGRLQTGGSRWAIRGVRLLCYIESLSWLLIVFGSEIVIRMQARGIAGGIALAFIGRAKVALYAAILVIAGYWGSKEQYLYLWDERRAQLHHARAARP